MAGENGQQKVAMVPAVTLTGFHVTAEPGPNGEKVLQILAMNGAMAYRVPLTAEDARKVGAQLMIERPRMDIPR